MSKTLENPQKIAEKNIGMELKKTVSLLAEARHNAVEGMAEAIAIAADAGDLLLGAREKGLDIEAILEHAQINGEQGRRLERVAKARPSLTNPDPGQLKQLALWAGILPDPIETTTSPRPEAHWLAYPIKAAQWVARKSPASWSDPQREEFVREARPIVEAWVAAGGNVTEL
jgi:hypothetical protein